ncbi:MAG: DUF4339 domain-containing protein [Planctomycetaceae bacterium]|nr:DUF4339 domain-containing protein [Planctomycetaceae bacterium]
MSGDPKDQRLQDSGWYYLEGGETRGPVAAAQLRRLFQAGHLGPETLLWRSGMPDWQSARALQGTTPPRTSPTDMPGPVADPAPSASAPPPDSVRRLPLLIAGAAIGVFILLGGIAIGWLLRSPATEPPASQQAAAQAAPAVPDPAPQSPSVAPEAEAAPDPVASQYQVIDLHRWFNSGVAGLMVVSQNMHYQILARLELAPRQADGTRQVTQVVEQTRLVQADEMSRATCQSALNDLVGRQFSYTLNQLDEITASPGLEPHAASQPAALLLEQAGLRVALIDEAGWRDIAQCSFQRPQPDIAEGQSWNRPVMRSWQPWGSWRGVTTYSRRGPEAAPGIRCDYVHAVSFVPSEPSGGGLALPLAGAQFQPAAATGSFVFDTERDRLVEAREVFHVKGTVTTSVTSVMGTETHLQVEERLELVIQISDQNPWLPGP